MSGSDRRVAHEIIITDVAARVVGGCFYCGRGPAADVSFMSVTGFVITWRRSLFEERPCHDCGIAESRDTLAHNASAGWWSPVAAALNVAALASNHRSTRAVRALPPASLPVPAGALPMGRVPALLRPRFFLIPAALAIIVATVYLVPNEVALDEVGVGMCVITPEEGDTRFGVVDCADGHDSEVTLRASTAEALGAASRGDGDRSPQEAMSAMCDEATAEVAGDWPLPDLRIDVYTIESGGTPGIGIGGELVCVASSADGSDLTGGIGDRR